MSEPYQDERWCSNCKDYTEHYCIDSDHERDSSGDYEKCLVCNWYKTGFDNIAQPPWE